MTRTAFMRPDQGVPNPYVMHVHPYPTRFHGTIYTRPVFGFPQIARPASVFTPGYDLTNGVKGLGALGSLWNVGNGIFKPGGHGGGVFDGNLSGLGSDAVDYPWLTKSQKTLELQQVTNQALRTAGYCPITEDGKLGYATCGARAQLSIDYAGRTLFALPTTCPNDVSQYTLPTPTSKGCSSSTPITTGPSTTTPPVTTASMSMPMSSSTKKALAFMAGGLLAAAAVVYMKKRKPAGAR